jgi:TetR/AcrR family transcriptional regulator, transcriptional repressor for nem operon
MSGKDEHVAELVNGVFDEWHEKVRKTVASAQRSRQVRGDVKADILAHHIIMSIEGGIMLARLKKSEKHLKECLGSLRALLGLKV